MACSSSPCSLTASAPFIAPHCGRIATAVYRSCATSIRSKGQCDSPGCSQHGESHWPLLRILVAHDLYTAVAMRPQWGAMNGAEAVSEQGLLEQAIDRLPRAAIVVGDANFGVFSVAYASTERDHPVVLRMTMARARSLTKGELQDGMDLQIQWTPTRADRRSHPELPADASVSGRLIVRRVQPSDGSRPFLLPLFTTLKDEAGSI